MNCRSLSDLYEVAARATINERCATAYLHDVRGSMQAIFSALELLGRSARKNSSDPERVEKVFALAQRAISFHEKSTLEVFHRLTLQDTACGALDLTEFVAEVAHFLRDESAKKDLTIAVQSAGPLHVTAERERIHALLVGLLAAAIDAMPSGATLPVVLSSEGSFAVVSIGSNANYPTSDEGSSGWEVPSTLLPHELTLSFARQYLATNGGRLEIDASAQPHGALRLRYPLR